MVNMSFNQVVFPDILKIANVIISLTELIRKAFDEDRFAGGIFIDLQKAFNTVDHNILLSKLSHYSVKVAPCQWFKSFLTGRQQYTTINYQKPSLSSIDVVYRKVQCWGYYCFYSSLYQ